jgi:hypothetical protein
MGVLAMGSMAGCGKTNGLLPPAGDGGDAALPPAATCTGPALQATETNSVISVSEVVDITCASVVGYAEWRSGAGGAACASPLDCAPTCVPCPTGSRHTLASWCNHGVCASSDDVACAILGTPLKSCGTQ